MVLLSRDSAYDVRALVTIAPVTTRIRRLATVEVPLGPDDGLPRQSVANLDTIQTVEKRWLRERITILSRTKIQAIDDAIRYALALGEATTGLDENGT